ncbi:MOSC domain-containing protein [Shewanella electrodiphila]|uniref:MOSC domain-containing protein n=1 Tax=Shewanella electrodiphila TaxID=934143 RepID=A0ABT0KTR7_9GAMM|nr:MOSC domain-containing protein [Shewanella electrodiphila]MCL1047241.1 MOSC domain-containing protein [Shewanella electrodiphila]
MAGYVLAKKISGLFRGDKIDTLESIDSGMNNKLPVQSLSVTQHGVEGDKQADPIHHGGEERVLHHFPREHYGQYRRWDLITNFKDVPAMGENISTVGLDESQVNIGDIIQIGEVLLQVTQPRSPCFKLNLQFGHPKFALAMQESRMCGWFYKVLQAGEINANDSIVLIERKTDISIAQAMKIYFLPEVDPEQYQQLMQCEGLAQNWVASMQRRIDTQQIENWQYRLYGPAGEPD